MRRLMPEELRGAVRGGWRSPAEMVPIEGVSVDSRTARAGDVFFALRGPNFDGHDFLPQAAAAGCVAAVVDFGATLDEQVMGWFAGGVVGVADTRVALGKLAGSVRQHLAASFVGVTGSNGKTTVKGMIDRILSRRLKGRAGPKSFNNDVGVPLTIFDAAADDDYVICEIGSNAPGEIAALTGIVRPDVAVITSVAETHLEKLMDLEHIAAEKAAILGGLGPSGLGVIWADSEPLERAVRAYDVRRVGFGESDSAELRLTGYEAGDGRCRFELNGRTWAELSVPGKHNALNALAAIGVAQRFGMDPRAAAEALGDYTGLEMRLERVPAGAVTIVNDAYNANPASLLAAGETLASFPGKRRVIVAGDMLELGPRSDELHRAAGEALSRCRVDLLVGVGPLGRQIAAAAAGDNVQTEQIASVEAACRRLPKMLKSGDVVLLKGSRAMGMERLVGKIQAAFAPARRAGKTRKAKPKC